MNNSKYRKKTLRNGGANEKVNPLIEKKLQNLYNQRKNFVKTINARNRKNMTKLNTIDLKIKEYVKNGYRGLRNSTRKLMNKVNNNLRNK